MIDNFKVTTEEMAGVSDLNQTISAVYPNPVVENFQVDFSTKFNVADVTLVLTDMTGKEVKSFAKSSSYNISDLPAGVYILKITDGKNTETKKIVKK